MKIKHYPIILFVLISGTIFAQSPGSYYEMALSQFISKDYDKSVRNLNQAIKLSIGYNIQTYPFYLLRGKSLYYLSNPDNSGASDFYKSIKCKVDDYEPYLYLSYIYAGQKQIDEAIQNLELAFQYGFEKDDSIGYKKEYANIAHSLQFNSFLEKNNLVKNILNIDIIRACVERKINAWQEKGKFEKLVDYQTRVSDETRNIQIQKYTKEVLDSMALSKISLSRAVNEYDPDNETFKISFKGVPSIFLKVPVDEAPDFDKHFNNLQYKNPEFTLDNNKFHILHLEIYNPGNYKTYFYNSLDFVAFSSTQLNINFDEINLSFPEQQSRLQSTFEPSKTFVNIGKADVDTNIPENHLKSENRFALIIGNEDYTKYQSGLSSEANVLFARNDAKVFADYAEKTFGIPKDNIKVLYDAIGSVMRREIERIIKMAQMTNGEIIFYYAGHGFPDEESKESYIMPVDITGTNVRDGIRLGSLYEQFSSEEISRATVFLDACFSGGGRDQGLLAARGVRIKPKEINITGNLVVFAATSQDQISLPYREQQHGIFTYFLLKKLQDSKGNLTYQELADYINSQVNLYSIKINYKEQSPSFIVSPQLSGSMNNLKFLD